MHYAFSREGLQALEIFVGRKFLAAFDFDGTLAPIAFLPERVYAPPGVRAALNRLRGFCPVAVISGRAWRDVRQRLGVDLDLILGNHGVEGLPGAELEAKQCLAACRTWVRQLHGNRLLAQCDPRITVEDKGMSLSLHYRGVRDAAGTQAALLDVCETLDPKPRIVLGKRVLNLLPPQAIDKGTALLRLMEVVRADAALYVGDDDTDEDVFALSHANLLTVRVGRHSESRAPYYLRAPQELPRLLTELMRTLSQAQHRPTLQKAPRLGAGR